MVVELKYQYYFFSITSMLHQKIIKVKIEFWRRISQSEIRNLAAAESEGGQKFLPPNPLSFCPPERSVWRAERAVSSVQNRFGFRQTNAPFFLAPIDLFHLKLYNVLKLSDLPVPHGRQAE